MRTNYFSCRTERQKRQSKSPSRRLGLYDILYCTALKYWICWYEQLLRLNSQGHLTGCSVLCFKKKSLKSQAWYLFGTQIDGSEGKGAIPLCPIIRALSKSARPFLVHRRFTLIIFIQRVWMRFTHCSPCIIPTCSSLKVNLYTGYCRYQILKYTVIWQLGHNNVSRGLIYGN